MTDSLVPTAQHTTGPFFPAEYIRPEDNDLTVDADGQPLPGERIVLHGRVLDGVGAPVVNAILEIWQTDGMGCLAGRGGIPGFKGWGRTWTDDLGRYEFRTLKPGPFAEPTDPTWRRPPVIAVTILGSGLMRPLSTAVFFPNESLNATDRQLQAIADPGRRRRLIAEPDPAGLACYTMDFILRGPDETPFFEDPT